MDNIKTWQERMPEHVRQLGTASSESAYKDAEIADLRAALARAGSAAPAAAVQPSEQDVKDVALRKINEIRNSIIGIQKMNWSEHIYPLVAALDEAGYEGMPYPEARAYYGSLIERAAKAEDALAAIAATTPEQSDTTMEKANG